METCTCWRKETTLSWDSWREMMLPRDRYLCYGTKECEECRCGGDPSKCDFYPEKRKENTTMTETTMRTASMWLAAQVDGKTYVSQDLAYSKENGFFDKDGVYRHWPASSFTTIDDIFECEWEEYRVMTREEAEKALNVHIIG